MGRSDSVRLEEAQRAYRNETSGLQDFQSV